MFACDRLLFLVVLGPVLLLALFQFFLQELSLSWESLRVFDRAAQRSAVL